MKQGRTAAFFHEKGNKFFLLKFQQIQLKNSIHENMACIKGAFFSSSFFFSMNKGGQFIIPLLQYAR